MKPECNVNQGELGSIVRDMLAEKNKTGRKTLSESPSNDLNGYIEEYRMGARLIDRAMSVFEHIPELKSLNDNLRSLLLTFESQNGIKSELDESHTQYNPLLDMLDTVERTVNSYRGTKSSDEKVQWLDRVRGQLSQIRKEIVSQSDQ